MVEATQWENSILWLGGSRKLDHACCFYIAKKRTVCIYIHVYNPKEKKEEEEEESTKIRVYQT